MAQDQEAPKEFEYTDRALRNLAKGISAERLAPYYVQARKDLWVAIRLYERNTRLSEALYGVVQGLEILLRNAIHTKLTERLGQEDWYDYLPLVEAERNEIEKAKKAFEDRIAKATPGKVVAELNFGFWVRLFSGQYEKELWVKHLRLIFAPSMQRKRLHDRLMQIKTLRNRIAHHETLIRRDLPQDYADILEAIGWISPTGRAWIKSTNSFEIRYAERLPKQLRVAPDSPSGSSADQDPINKSNAQ